MEPNEFNEYPDLTEVELNREWEHLRNGFLICGTASGSDDTAVEFNTPAVERLADAFLIRLSVKTGKAIHTLRISIGHDSRDTADKLTAALVRRFTRAGVQILPLGLTVSYAAFMTTIECGCDGAVMVTAGNRPASDNGLLFFTSDGYLTDAAVTDLLKLAQECAGPAKYAEETDILPVSSLSCDYQKQYARELRVLIREKVDAEDAEEPLKGMKIIIDAGNGVGGFYAEDVLKSLGADTEGSINLLPDGSFPAHLPTAEDPEIIAAFREYVLSINADLGILFDGDAGKACVLDSMGNELSINAPVSCGSMKNYPVDIPLLVTRLVIQTAQEK